MLFAVDGRLFLSTPSARRATKAFLKEKPIFLFLSTPSARRATAPLILIGGNIMISIHALREEGDFPAVEPWHDDVLFLSTPSARRATTTTFIRISTSLDFYPRPPRGGRPTTLYRAGVDLHFYPRPPRGGRLHLDIAGKRLFPISIHALREEGDSKNRDKISIFKQIIQHSARI